MLETILPSVLLEAVNGVALVLFVELAAAFAVYILFKLREYGWQLRAINYYELGAAKAMMTMAVGDMLIRGSVWYGRHMINSGHWVDRDTWSPIMIGLVIFGTIILTAGALCMIRVLLTDRVSMPVGRWAWALCGIAALAFGVGMAL